MSLAFALQLGLKIQKTNMKARKIDGTILEIYEIVVFTLFILNKDSQIRFSKQSFLLSNIKLEMVFGMFY